MAKRLDSAASEEKKGGGFFFLSLEKSMADPLIQVYKDDEFVCIKDKYPKAKYHFLLIPLIKVNGKRLLSVEELLNLKNAEDHLRKMRILAIRIANENMKIKFFSDDSQQQQQQNNECVRDALNGQVLVGFHSIQTMSPLHMHIVSADLMSDCIKHKKHYNSFTTKYFLKLDDLIGAFEDTDDDDDNENNQVSSIIRKFDLRNQVKLKQYLAQDLICHKCSAKQTNLPNLKKHLENAHQKS